MNINEILLKYYDVLLYLYLKKNKASNPGEYISYLQYLLNDNLVCSNVYGKTRCYTSTQIIEYLFEAKNAKKQIDISTTSNCYEILRQLRDDFKTHNMVKISIHPDHIFYIVSDKKNQYYLMSSWIYLYKLNIIKIDSIDIFIENYVRFFCVRNRNKLSLSQVDIDEYYKFVTKYFIYKSDIQANSIYVMANINNIFDITHEYGDFVYKDFYGLNDGPNNKYNLINHTSVFTFYDVNISYFNVENIKSTILTDIYIQLLNYERIPPTSNLLTVLFNWVNDDEFKKIYVASSYQTQKINNLLNEILNLLNVFDQKSTTLIVSKPGKKYNNIIHYGGGHLRYLQLFSSKDSIKSNKNIYYDFIYKNWKNIIHYTNTNFYNYGDTESILFINKNSMYNISNQNILLNTSVQDGDLVKFVNNINSTNLPLLSSINNLQYLLEKLNASNCIQIIANHNGKNIVIYILSHNYIYNNIKILKPIGGTIPVQNNTFVAYIKYKDQLSIINFDPTDIQTIFASKYRLIENTFYKSFRNLNQIVLKNCNIYNKSNMEQINNFESVLLNEFARMIYIDNYDNLLSDTNNYYFNIYINFNSNAKEPVPLNNTINLIITNHENIVNNYTTINNYISKKILYLDIFENNLYYMYLYTLIKNNYDSVNNMYNINNIISKYNKDIEHVKFFIEAIKVFKSKRTVIENMNNFYSPFDAL